MNNIYTNKLHIFVFIECQLQLRYYSEFCTNVVISFCFFSIFIIYCVYLSFLISSIFSFIFSFNFHIILHIFVFIVLLWASKCFINKSFLYFYDLLPLNSEKKYELFGIITKIVFGIILKFICNLFICFRQNFLKKLLLNFKFSNFTI